MDGVVTRVELFIFPPLPLTHEKIAPIQLAQAAPAEGTMATVSGWGDTTEGGFPSTHLQRTQVLVRESEKCQEDYYWRPITDGMLCAGYNGGGHDACNGDSGGPLVVNKQLVGIVSWGEGCARADFPGVYANVTHFLHWIAENRS
ncbi:trypsin eta-like [Scaptodrosophila lebanonensis]|uniref:trypsin n=1 Tax=Drosophila lebanonensis TaxID=7225 RepID=A0A6J2UIW8_DROLE|nr:trypsin eta-like [Scaptodrosophila lebanonensis]